MKVGVRKVNVKNRVKARTTGKVKRALKKSVNPIYGKKGAGLITDPEKAIYNKVYNKTTVSVDSLLEGGKKSGSSTGWELEEDPIETVEESEVNLDKLFKNAPAGSNTYKESQPEIDKEKLQALSSKYFKIGIVLLIISLIVYFLVFPPIGFIGVIASVVFIVKSRKYKKLSV